MNQTLNYAQFEEVAKNKYVDIASPLVLIHTNVNSPNYKTAVYGIEDSLFKLKPYWKLNGGKFSSPHSREAIVGANVAKDLNLQIGDKIYLTEKKIEVKIVSILSFNGTSDDNFLYVPLKFAQDLLDKSDVITAIAIKVKQDVPIGMVSALLAQMQEL